jgi:uncharacterized membrane protein
VPANIEPSPFRQTQSEKSINTFHSVLLTAIFCGTSDYILLQYLIIVSQGTNSLLKRAVGSDWKGKSSPLIYLIATLSTFWSPWLAQGLYVLVALLWLVPDRRIENVMSEY